MIFSSQKKNSSKGWILAFVLILFSIGAISVVIWLYGNQEETPLLLSPAEETHIPIQEWTTSQGMKVYLVTSHALPVVDVRLLFDAGSARDENLPGLAELTSQVLLQGSEVYNAKQISERIDSVGARLNIGVNRDMTHIGLRVLSEYDLFEQAFTTLLAILSKPTFPDEVVFREQQRLLTRLQEQQQLPSVIASQAFYAALYGDHPYAQPMMGTTESVKCVTRQNLVNFAAHHYTVENAVVAIVGDIDLESAKILAERLEAALPTGIPVSPLPEPVPLNSSEVINIPFNSTQTHVLYGSLGITRHDPSYYALYVGNFILGGSGLVSLLFEEVRETRGLAYSANSQLLPLQQTGPFIIGAQTRNQSAEEVITVTQQTVQNFIAQGPTVEQVSAAQSNITGNFALHLDSNAALAEQLGLLAFYNLPLNYFASFRAHILAVTPDQVKTAMQTHLNMKNTVLITVGDTP